MNSILITSVLLILTFNHQVESNMDAWSIFQVNYTYKVSITREVRVMDYLHQFGYVDTDPKSGSLITEEEYKSAIKDFQEFAGLDATGVLDSETRKKMSEPRCGIKDKKKDSRKKRYTIQGTRWTRPQLTYRVSKYSEKFKSGVNQLIADAFREWSKVIPLEFVEKNSGNVDMDIRFERRNHNCNSDFDGPGKTLAHAFYPGFGGASHFDDEEDWTNSKNGINFHQVATHEFGHALGLDHSRDSNAVMAPFYRYNPSFRLQEDDILGIQAIYGKKTASGLCSSGKIDAVFNTMHGETFVLKGDNCYKLSNTGVASGYPKRIVQEWPGLPGNIDAVFTHTNKRTYFFKGNQHWRFDDRKMDPGYPKSISDVFGSVPSNIDAAFAVKASKKVFFFKGGNFWKFDAKTKTVPSSYPKRIGDLGGVPENIDAAFEHSDGNIYFFKDDLHYKFDARTLSVVQGYPQSAKRGWFRC